AFADERRGIAVGTANLTTGEQKALIYATDDGGETWVSRLPANTAQLWAVGFAGHDQAFAVGCARNRTTVEELQCLQSSVLRVSFAAPEAAAPSGGGGFPWVIVAGAAFVLAFVALVVVVRRGPRPELRR